MDGSLIRMMILFCLQTTIRGIVVKNCLYFFGDSHVSRMQKTFEDASCSRKIDFISMSGLCMRDTAQYLERLRKFDVVIVHCGGNDVSFHPKKSNVFQDFPAHLSKSFKSFADGLGHQTKLKIIKIFTTSNYLRLKIRTSV